MLQTVRSTKTSGGFVFLYFLRGDRDLGLAGALGSNIHVHGSCINSALMQKT